MLFTRKHDVNIPPLYMNDDVLEDVLKHKHLGIHFCPNGTWKSSANSFIILETTSTISLINNINKRGSSMDPCGTPALM
jgi:hypothetical protein